MDTVLSVPLQAACVDEMATEQPVFVEVFRGTSPPADSAWSPLDKKSGAIFESDECSISLIATHQLEADYLVQRADPLSQDGNVSELSGKLFSMPKAVFTQRSATVMVRMREQAGDFVCELLQPDGNVEEYTNVELLQNTAPHDCCEAFLAAMRDLRIPNE
jgi:hypothetical protein